MIGLFARFASSLSVNESFVQNFGQSDPRTPIMLELWIPFCPFCAQFRPIWDEFVNSSHFRGRILFADVNCHENREYCKRLSDSGYPQVVWLDPCSNTTVQYNSAQTVDSIELFATKQFNYPIEFLNSSTNVASKSNISAIFVLSSNESDLDAISLIRTAATIFRESECRFVFIPQTYRRLTVYRSLEFSIDFQNNWTQECVNDFISKNRFPLLPLLSSSILDKAEENRSIISIFFTNSGAEPVTQEVARESSVPFQMVLSIFDKKEWICRYIGLNSKQIPAVVVIKPSEKKWSIYKGEWSAGSVLKWLNNFDEKRCKWSGAGTGPLSQIYASFYSLRAQGGLPFYAVIACLLIMVAAILFMAYDICTMGRDDLKKIE